ncbi:WecB/TagA/CpsF family glycosyltransferase [Vallitalea okinawensis]|uniref:WecB/TagA/CpsF family glycosyltransferase n=1 Tax=Vallitalea okinawensis TaxID=2078660 RepID=UPI000CFC2310|nr:WecB/TagA/CpsF family glycosyltransferase [Vallitalea okinawensis]
MDKIDVLGVGISRVDMKEATKEILSYLKGNETRMIFTPNPEFIMAAREDQTFKKILNEGDLVIPDGIGVVIGAKMLKTPLKERVPGYDLIQHTFNQIKDKNIGIYFLGSGPGVAEEAAKKMEEKFPGLKIVGCRDGYFDENEESYIVEEINATGADILYVALGAPKQEKFIFKHRDQLNVKIAMGVGGSFDGMAGRVKRAPVIFQKLNLEWFYRLISQPTRAKRMMKLPLFIIEVMKNKR